MEENGRGMTHGGERRVAPVSESPATTISGASSIRLLYVVEGHFGQSQPLLNS